MASAMRSITARLPVGRIRPGRPTRSPASTRISAKANATVRQRSSLLSRASRDTNAIEGERSGHSQIVCAASHSRSRT